MTSDSTADHHHGYMWLGSGFELAKDGPRRPSHPEFVSSKVVPLERAHWLLKPAAFIQGTWSSPRDAAGWFADVVRGHASWFASEREREASTLADRYARVAEDVARGEDAVGGWYLTGARFLSVSLIACSSHRFRPELRCPQRSPEPGRRQ
ncbi:hypothetical protein AB0E27_17855 [Streptomyces sparsogenes]|uniref:hypothetical protein n=1 Tax=Streptomyces sparsogenes TaxID=67365 RepID=UPI0033C3E483